MPNMFATETNHGETLRADLLHPMNLQLFADQGAAPEGEPSEGQGEAAEQKPAEKTFTQADVDRIVAERLARANRDTESRIKAARQEGRTEAERLAQMTEPQRTEHERQEAERAAREREEGLTQREQAIARRELRANAIETLRDKGLPVKLADALDYSSEEACRQSLELLEGVMRDSIQEGVDERIAASRNPLKRGGSDNALMAQVRSAMGLADKSGK